MKKTTTKKKGSKKTKQNSKKKIIKFLLIGGMLGILLLGVFFVSVYFGLWAEVPSKDRLKQIETATASEIYSSDNKILGRIYLQNRTNIGSDEIPKCVVDALIATEDARFYEHEGVDRKSLARVIFKTILLGDRSSGGGSTISQQIAKNLFPRKRLGVFSMPVAKIREAIIATRLEEIYSKEEILTLYLNTVPFGEDIYGIEEGAKRFFNKNAKNLEIQEAAVLIGMLKANTNYNPRLFPERSLHRRNVVLDQMANNGYLTKEELNVLMNKDLGLKYNRLSQSEGPAAYLREKIRVEVRDYLKNNPKEDGSSWNIYEDGLKIYTTLDYRMQKYAEEAMKKHMTYLQNTFERHWRNRDPWGSDDKVVWKAIKRTDRYHSLKRNGKTDEEVKEILDTEIPMKVFDWKNGTKEVTMSPLDSVIYYLRHLNTGILSVNPQSGEILTWVGGIDHRYFKYDHVLSKRQTGSVFKPIVYLSALEQGVSPYRYYSNERKVYEAYDNWSPGNSEGDYGGYYTMEGALSESLNTIAVDMIMEAGVENTIELAERMGIDSELPDYPSIALGTADISLFDMVQAYSVLANGGREIEPFYMIRIEDKNGNVIHEYDNLQSKKQIVDRTQVKILNHMMTSVTETGTAKGLRTIYGIEGELAGKTGTTQAQADGWYIGYNPKIVTGVWVGGEDPTVRFRSLTLGQGAHMALPIYARFTQKVHSDRRFRTIANSTFDLLDPLIMARLEKPHYKETEGLDNLFEIIVDGAEEIMKPRDGNKKVADSEEKKNIYEFIRSIFKKKDKDDDK